MNKQKQQNYLIALIVINIFFIAGIITAFTTNDKPEFTIYEKKCHLKVDDDKLGEYLYNKTDNKTRRGVSYDTGMGGYSNPLYKNVEGNFSGEVRVKKIITYPIVKFNISNPYKKGFLWEDLNDCEKVEVDKIEWRGFVPTPYECKNIGCKREGKVVNTSLCPSRGRAERMLEIQGYFCDEEGILVRHISKSNLTTEWLNNNAKILWCDLSDERKEKYPIYREKFGNCDYFKGINNEFDEWKLNNYIIRKNE